ncbi:unnamed protein product, partial [Chrysoparadoxa australica]
PDTNAAFKELADCAYNNVWLAGEDGLDQSTSPKPVISPNLYFPTKILVPGSSAFMQYMARPNLVSPTQILMVLLPFTSPTRCLTLPSQTGQEKIALLQMS